MNSHPAQKSRPWRMSLHGLAWLVLASAFTLAHASDSPQVKKRIKAPSQSRVELKTKANQVAAGIRAADAALSPKELAIAQRIEVGHIPCELGAFVDIAADARVPGYFDVQIKKFKFRMAPAVTSTGAIRLEDPTAGAVWLQLSNKSMLMNQKTGSRMADECKTPSQFAVADAMAKNPPPSLLEPLPVAPTSTVPSQSATNIPASTVR